MFKRNEDLYLEKAKEHIKKTYTGHYVNDSNIQAVDLWEAQGSLLTTARDTAEKYLMRFGKKNGENLEDLYKAIHFIVMMIHVVEKKRKSQSEILTKVHQMSTDEYNSCEQNEEEIVKSVTTPPNDTFFTIMSSLEPFFKLPVKK